MDKRAEIISMVERRRHWPAEEKLRIMEAALAPDVLKQDPFTGHLFAFRGRRGDLVKILYWDGQGFCLFAKRLEKGRFTWPVTREGAVTLTPAQLSMLLEGLEWRAPRRTWAPTVAG
jgi:transposase